MKSILNAAKDKVASTSSKAVGILVLLVSILCFFMMFTELATAYLRSVDQNTERDAKTKNDNEAPIE